MESIGRELVGVEKWEYIYPLQQVWHQEQTSDFDPTNAQVIEEAVKQEQLDVIIKLFLFYLLLRTCFFASCQFQLELS